MSQTPRLALNSLDLPRLVAFAKQHGLSETPAPGTTADDFRCDLAQELLCNDACTLTVLASIETLKNQPDSDFDEERKALAEAEEEFESDPTFAEDEDQWESETSPPKGRPLRPQDLGFAPPSNDDAAYHREELKYILAKVTCASGEELARLQIQAQIHAALLGSRP